MRNKKTCKLKLNLIKTKNKRKKRKPWVFVSLQSKLRGKDKKSNLCKTFDDKKLKEIIIGFIKYAPILDQILGLAPKHLFESEHNWLVNGFTNNSEFISHITKLTKIKEAIEKEKNDETNPSYKVYRGNAAQFLLNPDLNIKQKINYLKCMEEFRVVALDVLVRNLEGREFVNFCPWTTEKDYLLEYTIFHFYKKEPLPIYYYVAFYAQLLDIFATKYTDCSAADLEELDCAARDLFMDPVYIFPRKKELLQYMVLNKEANAKRTEKEKELIRILESKKKTGEKYIPLSNWFSFEQYETDDDI